MRHEPARIVDEPAALDEALAALARPLVFTNGCFDILHRGHVDLLQRAAMLGESLVVGVNSDASVRALDKGGERPLTPLADRMAVLAALGAVDLVVPFEEPTPLALISRVQPDHLVKGGDWPPEKIVGAGEVIAAGGRVHSLPLRFNRSTSALVQRIRAAGS